MIVVPFKLGFAVGAHVDSSLVQLTLNYAQCIVYMMNKVSQDWAKWKIFSSCLLFLVHLRRFGNRLDIDLESVLKFTHIILLWQ